MVALGNCLEHYFRHRVHLILAVILCKYSSHYSNCVDEISRDPGIKKVSIWQESLAKVSKYIINTLRSIFNYP